MTLSAAQLGLCFQSYWYMWLTNGLSGLLFIGIDIGIAAFFLKKFGNKKKPSTYQRPPSREERAFSPTHINVEEPDGRVPSRGHSTLSADSASIDDNEDFAHTACQLMNGVRQKYAAPPLQVNDQLSEIAQRWANEMARTGKLEHSPAEMRNFGRQTLGENYTARFQSELTADKMVRKWYKEARDYKFGANGTRATENFTQLVWRSSQEIGVGRAQSADGNWWYGVVVFDPPGNIPNQFATNVLLPEP